MNKKLLVIVAIITVPIIALAIVRTLSPEDSWIFNGIDWIKHGNPSAPKPDGTTTGRPLDGLISTASDNIKITSPKPNEKVNPGFLVTGEARVFESQFNWRLTTKSGKLLGQGDVIANPAEEDNGFGSFEFGIMYPQPTEKTGILEVFDYSAKDGSEIDKVSIPITFN
jgi:hypothetical protein